MGDTHARRFPGFVPGVRKIAVLRANGIGDYIFALPALEALRATYAEAQIVLLGKTWHRDFLESRPGPVDRVIITPLMHGVNDDPGAPDPVGQARFFAAMKAEGFDLAIQLHGGGGNSNPFVQRLGARLTAGTRSEEAPPLDRGIPYLYYQREVLRWLEVVALVGAQPVTLEPRLMVTARDRIEAGWVQEAGPLAVLHPAVSDPERQWAPERFAQVGDALVEMGARVLITGAASERDVTARVRAAMLHPAVDLGGRLSLRGLAALFARAAVVIANDSGPLHLAEAVGAATVGLYWCFNYINAAPMTQQRHYALISWQTHCPICGADRSVAADQHGCLHHPSFLDSLRAEAVIHAAETVFQGAGEKRD